MTCPACAAEVPEEDLYCEQCGGRLRQPPEPQPGCICGPEPGEVDDEGFCEGCGKRVRRPASDHIEEALSTACAAVSDRGLRHERNQDRFALAQGEGFALLVLCDGVSSTRDAEAASESVASAVAAHVVASVSSDNNDEDPASRLAAAILSAGVELRARAGEQPDGSEPSTTVVAALLQGACLSVAWLGDSRAYWHGESGTRQLTTDNSWIHQALTAGEMAEAEAQRSPHAHAITRWVGADADPTWEPECHTEACLGPGLLLLCTDGLWNYFAEPAALNEVLRVAEADGQEALGIARELVARALAQGGHDNVTVAVLKVNGAQTDA